MWVHFVDPDGSGPSGITVKAQLKVLYGGIPPHFMIPTSRDSTVYEKYTSKLETRMPGDPTCIHIKPNPCDKKDKVEHVDWIAEFNTGKSPLDICEKYSQESHRYIAMK
jgi:hypothetical protein